MVVEHGSVFALVQPGHKPGQRVLWYAAGYDASQDRVAFREVDPWTVQLLAPEKVEAVRIELEARFPGDRRA